MNKKFGFRIIMMLVCVLILFSSSVAPTATTQAADNKVKAVWLWHTTLIKSNPDDILTFAKNNQMNVIYLQMNADVHASFYKSFIRQATAQGIQVHVLGGASSWGLLSQRYRLETFINWIRDYQQAAAPSERFTEIHVDVEPHTLPEWRTNQASVIAQWQNNMLYLKEQADALGLPLAADIPFWLCNYSTVDGSSTLSYWLIDLLDSVTIMAYRDTASGIYSIARNEMLEADALGKKVVLGVETKASNEGQFITFFEEGSSYMNQQLAQVAVTAGKHPSFSGFAVHEYLSWVDLVSSGK